MPKKTKSTNITKNEIIDNIFQNNENINKNEIQTVIDSFLDELKNALINGNTIELRGFGTFETRLRKGKSKARNPKTGETISVEPHHVAAFRAGQQLKKDLWNLEK